MKQDMTVYVQGANIEIEVKTDGVFFGDSDKLEVIPRIVHKGMNTVKAVPKHGKPIYVGAHEMIGLIVPLAFSMPVEVVPLPSADVAVENVAVTPSGAPPAPAEALPPSRRMDVEEDHRKVTEVAPRRFGPRRK
jgi:hypothetical protein